MTIRIRAAALAVAAAFPCSAALASTDAVGETVVVTATRQQQRADEVLASVEVIDREQIERAGHSTLIDVLRSVPGLRVSSNGGAGANTSVFVRGAESRHTLLLIDGMRVGSATSGQPTMEAIPLEMIERIEILRGPASALYGSEAIGGVIQIFTRKGERGFQPELSAGYGSYGTRKFSAGVSGGVERARYSLRVGEDRTRGYDSRPVPAHDPDKDGFHNRFLTASLAVGLREHDEVGLNLYRSDGRNWYDVNRTFDSYMDKRLDSFGAHLINEFAPGWRSTLRAGRSLDRSYNRATAAAPSRFNTRQTQASWQNDIDLPMGTLMAAFDYTKSEVDSTTRYRVNERTVKAWLLGWSAAIDAHSVQANVRRDDNSQFGGKTTGLLSYGYAFSPQWSVRGSIATAFNAPTFNQLYWPMTSLTSFHGNPNLKPERALNRELGLRWSGAIQSLDLTYFDNRVRDLVGSNPIHSLRGQQINIAEARLRGGELAYSVLFDALTLTAGVDYIDARNEQSGKRLQRRAPWSGFVRIDYSAGAWAYGVDVNGQSQRFDDAANTQRMGGYGLVDAYVHYRIDPDWRVELRANNIFDKHYELARGYATPGASYFVGVRYAPR